MTSVAVRANLAQALVNVLFGASSVVSNLALKDINPVLFGLIRAVVTTVLLVALKPSERLLCCGRLTVRQQHVARFVTAGFCLFLGEFFYILGVSLAGSIRASLWQPSQPIWTMALTAILGHERMSWKKGVGLVMAFAGCAVMVLGASTPKHKDDDDRTWLKELLGNVCLFVNCSLGTPLYIVSVKPLLQEYPPFACAGLTFALNSMCFLAAMACAPWLDKKDPGRVTPPSTALEWSAVLYVAIFATVVPYALQLWATKILPASLVSAYYVLQPLAAAALVYTLLALDLVHLGGAEKSDLGAIAVLVGLVVIIWETPTETPKNVSEDHEGLGFLESAAASGCTSPTHNALVGSSSNNASGGPPHPPPASSSSAALAASSSSSSSEQQQQQHQREPPSRSSAPPVMTTNQNDLPRGGSPHAANNHNGHNGHSASSSSGGGHHKPSSLSSGNGKDHSLFSPTRRQQFASNDAGYR